MSQQDEISKLVEFYNRLKEMTEWNNDMSLFYNEQGDYEKQFLHEAASGALHAAAVILEQDYIINHDAKK